MIKIKILNLLDPIVQDILGKNDIEFYYEKLNDDKAVAVHYLIINDPESILAFTLAHCSSDAFVATVLAQYNLEQSGGKMWQL